MKLWLVKKNEKYACSKVNLFSPVISCSLPYIYKTCEILLFTIITGILYNLFIFSLFARCAVRLKQEMHNNVGSLAFLKEMYKNSSFVTARFGMKDFIKNIPMSHRFPSKHCNLHSTFSCIPDSPDGLHYDNTSILSLLDWENFNNK